MSEVFSSFILVPEERGEGMDLTILGEFFPFVSLTLGFQAMSITTSSMVI